MLNSLLKKLKRKEATIGIVGLGYVGLPLMLRYVEVGFRVLGLDIDKEKIFSLNDGTSYIKHIASERIKQVVEAGLFEATSDFARAAEADALLICVPTPLTKYREPDLSYVTGTLDSLLPYLRAGQVVSLESTTYPGTTDEVLKPRIENRNLRVGTDIFLVYSPEREDPANGSFTTQTIPKVCGGDTDSCLQAGIALYEQVIDQVVPVSSTKTAEMTKLLENIYRAVNIGLVNELKIVADRMGIDIWEVIKAAATKPFGFMPFYPGPGLGGHCIPIDPFYLTWRAKQFGQKTRFIELAGEINTAMPNHVVDVFEGTLKERFEKSLDGAKILILGVAYKKNIDDVRESPAFAIIELLEEKGAETAFYDPHIKEIPTTREHMGLAGRCSIEWLPETFGNYDAALIVTDHDGVDYEALVRESGLVVDSRNATRAIINPAGKIIRD